MRPKTTALVTRRTSPLIALSLSCLMAGSGDATQSQLMPPPGHGASAQQPIPEESNLAGLLEFTIPKSERLGLPSRVAALLMSGQEGGKLSLTLLATPQQTPEGKHRVSFVIDVNTSQLPVVDGEASLSFELFVYAITQQGGVGGHLAQAFSLPSSTAIMERGGFRLMGDLETSSDPLSVRMLLRHPASDTFGLRKAQLSTNTRSLRHAILSSTPDDAQPEQ